MDPKCICLDMGAPLEERLQALTTLPPEDVDNILECLCSAYLIRPTFVVGAYLQHVILTESLSLLRRFRLAEVCDMGALALYLLARMRDRKASDTAVIRAIEWLSTPALKVHAYCALYARTTHPEIQIQIHKNLLQTVPSVFHESYFRWFHAQMQSDEWAYKYRTDCADVFLRYDTDRMRRTAARRVLGLTPAHLRVLNVYDHRENVHLFVPRAHVLQRVLTLCTQVTPLEELEHALLQSASPACHARFVERIVNDRTLLGNQDPYRCTLVQLWARVWGYLTPDLQQLLIQDVLQGGGDDDDEWMCTTGYYHRILNVFQVCAAHHIEFDEWVGDKDQQKAEFVEWVYAEWTRALQDHELCGEILGELPAGTREPERMRYLRFKVHWLPQLLERARAQFTRVNAELLAEWFGDALRRIEGG